MRNRLKILWDAVSTSIWPVPTVMLLLALALRYLAFGLDAVVGNGSSVQTWWLHSGSGDDARNLLSTLVTALITMASVMFSITMVVLSLAANQFGSRLVRTYMADLRTQLALGTFLMTVVYCLLVLRTVSADMDPAQVPHVAVTLALVLSLVCILTLLLFLHVLTRSMIADDVVRRVARELEDNIDALPPLDQASSRDVSNDHLPQICGEAVVLRSSREGYVQSIDYDGLSEVACRHDLMIQVCCSAGAFMCKDGWLAAIYGTDGNTAAVAEQIEAGIEIGEGRTPTQDLEFSIRHLVDVALRALSPGINDAHTAIAVIDRLRGALSRLLAREIPSTVRRDANGRIRVVGHDTGYIGIFDEALNKIRQSGAVHPAIIIHMLGAISRMAEHVRLPEQRDALQHHLKLVAEAGLRKAEAERDRHDIETKRAEAEQKLQEALRPPLFVG